MIHLIRWLKGYVKIKLWGYSPERFMNLCTNSGILLWNVKGFGEYYEMYMSVSDFFSIQKIVRKTKTRVAVIKRCGLPFLMKDAKKRKFFIAGIIGCTVFLFVIQQFLWSIQFEGNFQITDEVLMNFLNERGIDYGCRMKRIDAEFIEDELRGTFTQITWTSVHIKGTKLIISVKENDLPEKEKQLEEAATWAYGADIVAAKDGVIVEILTREGVPQVKISEQVEKGTVLVSGQVPVMNDDGTVREWIYRISDADILIQYDRNIKIDQPYSYEYKNYTGREKKYRYFIFGKKRYVLKFGNSGFLKVDEVSDQKRLRLFAQIDLPIFFGTLIQREYLPVEAVYDENSAKKLLENRFFKIIDGLEQKGVQIIKKDVKIVRKTDGLRLTGTISVLEEAVLLRPTEPIEEQDTLEDGEA